MESAQELQIQEDSQVVLHLGHCARGQDAPRSTTQPVLGDRAHILALHEGPPPHAALRGIDGDMQGQPAVPSRHQGDDHEPGGATVEPERRPRSS